MNPIRHLSRFEATTFLSSYLGKDVSDFRSDTMAFAMPKPKGENAIWSMPEVEAQFLYACVRAVKPKTVLELGTHLGYSTTFIAAALEANNRGRVVTLDYKQHENGVPRVAPSYRIMPVEVDGVAFSKCLCFPIDMIFEDGNHIEENTYQFLANCLPRLAVGGLIVVHDVALVGSGSHVTTGMIRALGDNIERVVIADSPCGLGFWIKR
jgi:predicted O-methyltransferase YrrM